MRFLRAKATTWLAMVFLCLLFFIDASCGSSSSTSSSSSPASTSQNTNTSQAVSTQSSQIVGTQVSVTETATSDNAGATATAQVAAEQTMTAVATDTNQSFPTPTAAPSPTSDNAGATATAQIAAEQTMTAVATDTNQSFPTTIATPTSSSGTSSPLLELDKTSLHASSDCTTSANADGNNHSGWICALTLTNPGATDLNWTSNPSSSTVGIYVQDTQTWNQGIVLAGQQQHVDFVVQGDTSACSGSYALTLNSSANPISVTWDC